MFLQKVSMFLQKVDMSLPAIIPGCFCFKNLYLHLVLHEHIHFAVTFIQIKNCYIEIWSVFSSGKSMFRANNKDKGATFGQRTTIVQSKCMDIFIVNFEKKEFFT